MAEAVSFEFVSDEWFISPTNANTEDFPTLQLPCDEDDLPDSLLLEAIESFESATEPEPRPKPRARRFAVPMTDEEVESAKEMAIPEKTRKDTQYCVRLFESWRLNRIAETGITIPSITEIEPRVELAKWMERFVLEVRKQDGSLFQSASLNHVVAGIMRHLRSNGKPDLDFYQDVVFHDLRKTLDGEMKRLKATGENIKRRQAEPITEEEEEKLWNMGLLGDHSPQALLDTMLFCSGLYFALRSGGEHRQLRRNPCQIELIENTKETPFLRYTEDVSKNRQGGLKSGRIAPKVVTHYANLSNPSRCFVRLFKEYQRHCPKDSRAEAFYLMPLHNPQTTTWYSHKAVGHNKLQATVQRICKAAGIRGYKTNHSLRATAATRLYHQNVDEQLIMERTGHRSLDGIRSYKRTSAKQQQEVSQILNNPSGSSDLPPAPVSSINSSSAPATTGSSLPLTLTSCSNIIININNASK